MAEASVGGEEPPPWRALPIVLLAQFTAVLDFFIVNVALPSIGSGLRAGPAQVQFVVAGYGLAYACGLVAGGRFGDLYGRRRTFVVGVGLFTAASALCGFAPSAYTLIGARVVQGIGAAVMVPQILATIQASFTGRDRGRALAAFGATTGTAFAAGQVVGGVLVSANLAGSGWRSIFLINVPIGLLAMLTARWIPDTRSSGHARVDLRGAVLLAVTLLALLVPVTFGREAGWPVWCWSVLSATPVLGLLFWYDQRRTERRGGTALLPPVLLRQAGMRRGLPVAILFFPCFGGLMLTVAVALQAGWGLSPLRTGLAIAPQGLSYLAMSLIGRYLVTRYGRMAITAGAVTLAAGLSLLTALAWYDQPAVRPALLVPAMALIGAGQALLMVPLFGVILNAVPPRLAGAASGVLTTTQQTGLALGAGLLGTLFFALAAALGWRPATTATLSVASLLALAAAVASIRLPDTTDPIPVVPGPT